MKTTTAVLLGGGVSSRFYPFNSQNKSLISIGGKTLFKRTLDSLKKVGIGNIIVVEDSKKTLSSAYPNADNITFVTQNEAQGMGDALLLVKDLITEAHFFVLSPYHFEFDLFAEELDLAVQNETDIAIVTKKDDDSTQFGGIAVGQNGISIHEKSTETFHTRIVAMYLLNTSFLEVLKNQEKKHYSFEDAISNYKSGNVTLVEAVRETISLKFPWDLLPTKDYILKTIESFTGGSVDISSSAVISGNVYISSGVTIKEGAVITGPAFIGENVYIGTNAILRGGVILEGGNIVGAGMEIKNSILMKYSTTHSGFIGDSIIGENVKVAAGFITGNVRLDRSEVKAIVRNEKINTHKKSLGVMIGENSSIGIHVGTMPGVIIGKEVKIGPGTTVMENIEDSVTYFTDFKETVKK